eukprot:1176662-Prorocentrum_minimum.AAC.1
MVEGLIVICTTPPTGEVKMGTVNAYLPPSWSEPKVSASSPKLMNASIVPLSIRSCICASNSSTGRELLMA